MMSMFIIYINNDDEDKKLRIEEVISDVKKERII